MIYAISDIHGQFDMLKEMLKKIEFSREDHLYVLGDVVDRGYDSIKSLLYLHNKPNVTILKGNHEDMMCEYFEDTRFDNWLWNGGYRTLEEYTLLSVEDRDRVLAIIRNLSYMERINLNNHEFILVHAGVHTTYLSSFMMPNDDRSSYIISKEQDKEYMTWARREFYGDSTTIPEDTTVIFGHTPTKILNEDGVFKVWHGDGKVGIDCGAAYGGKLACLRLNDMKEFYI